MSSDLNERPAGWRPTPCPLDGRACEGQGTEADCGRCAVVLDPLARRLYTEVTGHGAPRDRATYEILRATYKAVLLMRGHPTPKGAGLMDKELTVTNMQELRDRVPDVEVFGDPGAWVCLCKASSQSQGWMKSTKALEVPGLGVLVQVSTQQGVQVAEALVFVPGAAISNGKIRREGT